MKIKNNTHVHTQHSSHFKPTIIFWTLSCRSEVPNSPGKGSVLQISKVSLNPLRTAFFQKSNILIIAFLGSTLLFFSHSITINISAIISVVFPDLEITKNLAVFGEIFSRILLIVTGSRLSNIWKLKLP